MLSSSLLYGSPLLTKSKTSVHETVAAASLEKISLLQIYGTYSCLT